MTAARGAVARTAPCTPWQAPVANEIKLMISEVSKGSCGVLGGLFGSEGAMTSQRRDREVPGRFWGGPGGVLASLLFSFFFEMNLSTVP